MARPILSFVLVLLLLGSPLVSAQSDDEAAEDLACDFNRDGRFDDVERRRCDLLEKCDENDDSVLDPEERSECEDVIRETCDTNEDGRVDDFEHRQCGLAPPPREQMPPPEDGAGTMTNGTQSQSMPCDANRDGRVDDRERAACEPPRDPCDLNADGRIDEREHDACRERAENGTREPPRDGAPMDVSPECRAAIEETRAEREAFEADMRERRDAFAKEQRERHEEFDFENASEEERAEFEEENRETRDAFEEEMRGERDEFEASMREAVGEVCPPPPEGDAAHRDGRPACAPDESQYERFREHAEEDARRFAESAEERRERFREHQEIEKERFEAENHTEDEAAEFERVQARERARFEAELEAAALRQRENAERAWNDFREGQSRGCLREGERGVEDVQRDARDERLACALESHEKLEAFFDENGRNPENWTDDARDELRALREEADRARAECQAEQHESWKGEAREALAQRKEEDRFGQFEHESSEDGSGEVTGRFVSLSYDQEPLTIADYAVQGLVLFESFTSPEESATARAEGRELKVRGDSLKLEVHDAPNGHFAADCGIEEPSGEEGDPDACILTLPDGAEATELDADEDGGATRYEVAIGDAHAILLVQGPHFWSGEDLEVQGRVKLFVPAENFVFEGAVNAKREELEGAVKRGRVLAEIDVVKGERGAVAQVNDYSGLDEETGEEEGVEVEVEESDEGEGVVVSFGSEATSGRTVILNLDASFFEACLAEGGEANDCLDPEDFIVKYEEVGEDGEASEVEIVKADGLADVLESDEDSPEWWLVLDEDGIQLLVSNPHFSEKRVTVLSAPDAGGDGSGAAAAETPGLGAALVAVALAGAAGLVRRRKA